MRIQNWRSFFLWVPLLFCSLLMGSCNAIDIHPYDCNISGEQDINRRHIQELAGTFGKNVQEFRFAFISDTQRWYDETEDAVRSINGKGVDFVIHGGDLSDFGGTKEFLWQRDILNGLDMPWLALLGNHDCLGSGEQAHSVVFGEPNFHFVVGDVLFVCLNTNALEFDYSTPVPDFDFMADLLANMPKGVERTIFVMHVRPYADQFNNNVSVVFDHYTREFPNVQFYLFGHEHTLMETDLFENGIMWYGIPSINRRQYYIFTVNREGYSYEVVDF